MSSQYQNLNYKSSITLTNYNVLCKIIGQNLYIISIPNYNQIHVYLLSKYHYKHITRHKHNFLIRTIKHVQLLSYVHKTNAPKKYWNNLGEYIKYTGMSTIISSTKMFMMHIITKQSTIKIMARQVVLLSFTGHHNLFLKNIGR